MLHRSCDKSILKKTIRTPSCRIDNVYCPETIPQYFQVSVNVLEVKKLQWSNPHSANCYVIVSLGKKKLRTSIRRGSNEPVFREFFVFEMYSSIQEIEQSNLWLGVMEPRICCAPPRLLGEANIDLGAIWMQPHHQVFHKWAHLSLPRDTSAGSVGFIKVDISIIFRGEIQVMPASPVINDDKIEDSPFLPSGSEHQPANYLITLYGAFGLPSGQSAHGEKTAEKLPSTFVRVSFCGLVAKTSVQHRSRNPVYNELISMVEMFPNMSGVIRFEVCSAEGCFNRILAVANLRLDQISHDGENGFLPTYGPSLIHMYGATSSGTIGDCGPYHRGALMCSLKTVVPYYQQGLRSTNVEPVAPVKPETLWKNEEFCVLCPLLEVSMLDIDICGKQCGVAITIGEIDVNGMVNENFQSMKSELKRRKLHYTGSMDVTTNDHTYGHIPFPNAFPVLQLALSLPDFRFRMYRNNMIQALADDLESAVNCIESRLKGFQYEKPSNLLHDLNLALDDTCRDLEKLLEVLNESKRTEVQSSQNTELDTKQYAVHKEEIGSIYKTLLKSSLHEFAKGDETGSKESRKTVKSNLADAKAIVEKLRKLIFKSSEGWPDVVIWILNSGTRVAYGRIPAVDVIFSEEIDKGGQYCGRIRTLFMKPIKCHKHLNSLEKSCCCIAGKVELLVWMGTYQQKPLFENFIPCGYTLKFDDFDMALCSSATMLEYRAFVYKAKLNNNLGTSFVISPYLRINALNCVKETEIIHKSLTPIWNQVLKITKMVSTTTERIVSNPPVMIVEVCYNDPVGKSELIGRIQLIPTLEDRLEYEFAPSLQWVDIYKGIQCTGQVLMSVQLLKVEETTLKTTEYNPSDDQFSDSEANKCSTENCIIERLPNNLIPKLSSFKVDVYWWGLRDVNITKKPCIMLELDDLTIKSEVIVDKKPNCNFSNGKVSHYFEAPLNEVYCPHLNIRLFDISTFGRAQILGTNDVKNLNKFLVRWLPKEERDMSLKTASFMSAEIFKANESTISLLNAKNFTNVKQNNSLRSIPTTAKISKWRRIFSKKEPNEEETILLSAMISTKVDTRYLTKKSEIKDWWLRFLWSQKDSNYDEKVRPSDKFLVYQSELESQPEFSKFKDWCSTLKLYNSQNNPSIDEEDEIYCGYLKAGIAIYNWPPAPNINAVSPSGVDLNKGFFDEYPDNNSSKHLVRVYVVKGCNLIAKDFNGTLNPYVIINCGPKTLGDRSCHVPRCSDPIFGRVYEFHCTLPEDYLLNLSVFDYNTFSQDELIGSTSIDLEDRIFSKHRARVGLPAEYSLNGPLKWRDCMKPSEILEEICEKNHLLPPIFPNSSTVLVNGIEYKDTLRDNLYGSAIERKENVCLQLLHNWHTMPVCGHHLVKEHVETRALYNQDKSCSEQGYIQLWVDIFPIDCRGSIPMPVDITPRKIEEYQLRIIIWELKNVSLDNVNERKCSDIYVKAWIGSEDQSQQTDIHFNFTGSGPFNWRMIYNIRYQPVERKLISLKKGPFTEFDQYVPPVLIVQILDCDAIQNEFLGALALNINALPCGQTSAGLCNLDTMECSSKINLFNVKTIRRWWPLKMNDRDTGENKLKMTLITNLTEVLRRRDLRQGIFMRSFCAIKSYCCRRGNSIPVAIMLAIATAVILGFLYVTYTLTDVWDGSRYSDRKMEGPLNVLLLKKK